jgi:hypothetical protein
MDIQKSDQKQATIIAQLEMRVDFLETQLCRLNEMLIEFGFHEGIKSLTSALGEAIEIEKLSRQEKEPD